MTARQGVNVVSQPPNVPNIYQWKDPVSGDILLNLNHRNGYGGWRSLDVVAWEFVNRRSW